VSEPRVRGLAFTLAALYFVQGLGDPASGVLAQPLRALLKLRGEDAGGIAAVMALLALPWSLKPVFALIADFVPLAGSHRRHYLLAVTCAAALALIGVALLPTEMHSLRTLFGLLLVAALAVAWSDVICDAVMIEFAQPRALTGRLQALQWTALCGALLVAGAAGGWFTQMHALGAAAVLCGMTWLCVVALVARYVVDNPRPPDNARATAHALRAAARSPALLWLMLFLFLWSFNPSWETVQYLHFTSALGFSEETYGYATSCFALGSLIAAASYSGYCQRLPFARLLQLAIACGVASYLAYLHVTSTRVLYGISLVAGAANMTSNLAVLDIAARRVPLLAAASVFALLMAVVNLAAASSEAFGGWVYAWLGATAGVEAAYRIVVVMSAFIAAGSWWAARPLAREWVELRAH
jgi:MFS family permease